VFLIFVAASSGSEMEKLDLFLGQVILLTIAVAVINGIIWSLVT
jgi:hypothetical protein